MSVDTLPPQWDLDLEDPTLLSPPAHPRPRASTLKPWLRRHRRSLVLVAGLMVVVGVVHGVGMNSFPAPVDDEGTYVAEAWAVVMRHALTPYTYWYDHPPLGWIALGGWAWLTHGFRTGQNALVTGRQMILVTQLVGTALLYGIARRLGLSRPWSAAAALFWALSPLDVYYGRMVYLDNLAVPWLLGSMLLALSPRRNLWAMCGSGVLFACAVLSKETLLIFLPAVLWQVWQQAGRRTRSFCLTGFLVSFLLAGIAYPLYATLKGELLPGRGHVSLWQAIVFQLSSRQSSGSVLGTHTQAHALLDSWLGLDPWLLGSALCLLPLGLLVRRLRPVSVGYLIALIMAARGGYLPQPYVIAVLPLAALVVVGVTAWCWDELPSRLAGVHRHLRVAPRFLVGLAAAVVAVAVVPGWASADSRDMTTNAWTPFHQAEAWLEANVAHRDRILIDDTMWVDLEQNGFDGHLNVVWFYKLGSANNLDPSVEKALPGGWRDFAYVVVTPSMRAAVATDPSGQTEVLDAVNHSTAVAHFGSGGQEIVIRQVDGGGPTSDITVSS